MKDQESENLLARIMSLEREKNKPTTPHDANAVASTQAENGTQDESKVLDKFLEALEKKQEEALIREFKTNIDYAMLPKMISQKAQALKTESKTIRAEITRLESMLRGTANENYQHEREQQFDTGKNGASDASFVATVGNGVGGYNP